MDANQRDDGTSVDTARDSSSKIANLIIGYDLDGLGDDLEQRWLGRGDQRQSLRSLADYFNQRLLEAELKQAGANPIEGEVENLYQTLSATDISKAKRTEVETKLAREGLDIESLRRDFVSHQAVHNYLTEVRGAELPSEDKKPSTTIENRDEVIQRLKSRLETVTERSIKNLHSSGVIAVGAFDVVVNLTIHCSDCGTSRTVGEFLRERGCQCSIDGE